MPANGAVGLGGQPRVDAFRVELVQAGQPSQLVAGLVLAQTHAAPARAHACVRMCDRTIRHGPTHPGDTHMHATGTRLKCEKQVKGGNATTHTRSPTHPRPQGCPERAHRAAPVHSSTQARPVAPKARARTCRPTQPKSCRTPGHCCRQPHPQRQRWPRRRLCRRTPAGEGRTCAWATRRWMLRWRLGAAQTCRATNTRPRTAIGRGRGVSRHSVGSHAIQCPATAAADGVAYPIRSASSSSSCEASPRTHGRDTPRHDAGQGTGVSRLARVRLPRAGTSTAAAGAARPTAPTPRATHFVRHAVNVQATRTRPTARCCHRCRCCTPRGAGRGRRERCGGAVVGRWWGAVAHACRSVERRTREHPTHAPQPRPRTQAHAGIRPEHVGQGHLAVAAATGHV